MKGPLGADGMAGGLNRAVCNLAKSMLDTGKWAEWLGVGRAAANVRQRTSPTALDMRILPKTA
eukprot:9276604-Alexandrium_andersonii.AAC.1